MLFYKIQEYEYIKGEDGEDYVRATTKYDCLFTFIETCQDFKKIW
ncbi:hypothetical protein bcere0022_30810 [Bacillus cereus Rock3-44]|nr:hypothetical protein bcere0022_30810 [Bacillus cereus Rock3-44]